MAQHSTHRGQSPFGLGLGRVNQENGLAARLVGQANLHVHLQAAWPQQRLINQVLPVGHTNQQDVVQGVHTIDLGQQLVDNGILS
jgi:hypothetical protein